MITLELTPEELVEIINWGDHQVGDYPETDEDRIAHALFSRLGKLLEEIVQPHERPTD